MTEDAVWLSVLPDMSRFGQEMGRGAEQEADRVGKDTGKRFGAAAAAGVAVVAKGAILAGKALYNVGETFDEVTDILRAGTGATGEELEGLVNQAKRVGTQVPADFDAIANTLGDVNTRLGLTGEALETVTSQALEASRITGEEVDVTTLANSFNVFQLEGEETVEAMDHLFRVSQATGIGMNDLASNAASSAPALQSLGFSFEETTALVGNLDKAGINSSKMMAGMGRALVTLAKDGEEPADAFRRTTGEIEAFLEEGDKASAVDLASQLFGTRNASQFIGALETGALSMEDLNSVAGMTEDTILGVGEETMDFSEHWKIFANRMSVLVAPIAEKVFGLIGDGMQWINDYAVPWIEDFFAGWGDGEEPVDRVVNVFGVVWEFLRDKLFPIFADFGRFLIDTLVPYFRRVVGVISDVVLPILTDMWTIFNERILPILKRFADFITKNVVPVVKDFAERVVIPLMKLVGDAIKVMWERFAKPALENLWSFIENYLGPAIGWLWEKVISPTFKRIGDTVDAFGRNWQSTWQSIQEAAAKPVNFIIETVYNNGIRKVLNLIPGVDLGEATPIRVPPAVSRGRAANASSPLLRLQDGGLVDLPWSAANRDPFLGMTPDGAFRFEGEEYFIKRDSTRKLEQKYPGYLDHLNRFGDLPGHRGGGRVNLRGHTFSALFASAIIAAEQALNKTFRITQGGFRPRTSYSGTSHAGDAVDIARPYGTRDIVSLRSQGVAAWDRAGKGNWIDHIHGVPLPGHGYPAGSAVWQAQDYLRGGDGLGGRDNGPRVGVSGDAGGIGSWFAIPSMLKEILDNIAELTSPWGKVFANAARYAVDAVKSWVTEKFEGIGEGLSDLILGGFSSLGGMLGIGGGNARGYLSGTHSAAPGLAWLSEDGRAELVVGPQVRNMVGGERVVSNPDLRSMFGTQGPQKLTGRLRIDEDSNAWVEGIVSDTLDDRGTSADRWSRMGAR